MRWIRGLVPLVAMALVGAGTVVRPPVLAASDPPWVPPPCTDAGPPATDPGTAWYRLDAVLDGTGTLSGQRLTLGVAGGATRTVDLPAESFATGPVRGLVLVGADDGTRTRLSAVDAGRGCETVIGEEAAIVRSALLAPDVSAVWEHRVARDTRADLGVWRRPLDGGRVTRQLPGPGSDDRYGRTFATELRFAADGSLAASSCGELACRTRLVDAASGRVTTVGPTGLVLGVARDGGVIAYRPCGGYPCAILRYDRDGGLRMLVPEAGRGAMAGDRVVFEDGRASGLRVLDLATGAIERVGGPDGLVPIPGGSRATAGSGLRGDGVLLAPGGRLDGSGAMVLGPHDTTPAPATEAAR